MLINLRMIYIEYKQRISKVIFLPLGYLLQMPDFLKFKSTLQIFGTHVIY